MIHIFINLFVLKQGKNHCYTSNPIVKEEYPFVYRSRRGLLKFFALMLFSKMNNDNFQKITSFDFGEDSRLKSSNKSSSPRFINQTLEDNNLEKERMLEVGPLDIEFGGKIVDYRETEKTNHNVENSPPSPWLLPSWLIRKESQIYRNSESAQLLMPSGRNGLVEQKSECHPLQ